LEAGLAPKRRCCHAALKILTVIASIISLLRIVASYSSLISILHVSDESQKFQSLHPHYHPHLWSTNATKRKEDEPMNNNNKKNYHHHSGRQDDGTARCCAFPSCQNNQTPWPTSSDGCMAEIKNSLGSRPYCQFHDWMVDRTKINSKNMGGEPLDSVMGQTEQDEELSYQPGAFVTHRNFNLLPSVAHDKTMYHYVNQVLSSLKVVTIDSTSSNSCPLVYNGTTLFIQRYEYVNLYHTLTDWWNTWTVYRHLDPASTSGVVFLDAHPSGNLDDVWTTLFGKYTHLRRLSPGQPKLCFERALLVPPGYACHFHLLEDGCHNTQMMNDFVNFVLEKLDLTHIKRIPGHVVLIDRKPYIAHPRSRKGTDNRAIHNLQEVAQKIESHVPNITSVRILQLHAMSFREQVQAVREAEVLVGNHGAGLSHLVFMDVDTHVMEFQTGPRFFVILAQWKERLTLHLLPQVHGNISDPYIENNLVPSFLSLIYPSFSR
jgi:glycoprotein 2-beta-D-xylosyltransferase